MRRIFPYRWSRGAALLLVAALPLSAGASGGQLQVPPGAAAKPSAAVSNLPAARTTGQAADATQASDAGRAGPTANPARRGATEVQVESSEGMLSVVATNASLNEILREVARKTGIKITGGVADERVFGSYGPAPAPVVLAALLEGTGSNMLLVDDAAGRSELVLTPRNGGPTPPNPDAAQSSDSDGNDSGAGAYVPPIRPYQPPTLMGRGPVGGPVGPVPVAPTEGGDAGDPTPPPTPQQIYDLLQKQQQRQNQTVPQ